MCWGCRLLQAIHKSVLKSEGNLLHSPVVQLLLVLTELCSSRTLNGMKSTCGTVICYTRYLWPAHNSVLKAYSSLYSWSSHAAQVFSALCFTCMHLWFSQYFKNVVDQMQNIRIPQFLQDTSSPTKESESEDYPILSCGFTLEHEKCVIFIPPCSVPGLNLESCLDALPTKLLFFVGFHSSQHSRATPGNWEGAIFNYFLYFAAQ